MAVKLLRRLFIIKIYEEHCVVGKFPTGEISGHKTSDDDILAVIYVVTMWLICDQSQNSIFVKEPMYLWNDFLFY